MKVRRDVARKYPNGVIWCDIAPVYEPVCGCDGMTYANSTTAECEGIRIAYEGECE